MAGEPVPVRQPFDAAQHVGFRVAGEAGPAEVDVGHGGGGVDRCSHAVGVGAVVAGLRRQVDWWGAVPAAQQARGRV